MSAALVGRATWNKGISPSEETRRKQSEAHKGKTQSRESIEKRVLKQQQKWEITFPDGHKEIIFNLKKFCREHELRFGAMIVTSPSSKAKKKQKTHRNYSCRKLE